MPTIDGSPDLIARDHDVLAIAEALAAGRGVAIFGPPASGVSALLHHVLRQVRRQGRLVIGDVSELPASPERGADDAADDPLLFLDDADRLDASRADGIARATLLGRVVPVVASTNRASPVMSRLRSSAALIDISIEPLDATGVHELVQAITGAAPDGATTRRLLSDSAGLPGLLVPTVRASTDDGSIVVSHGEGRVVFREATHAAQAMATLRYVDHQGAPTERYPLNPNGSAGGLTGFTTADGRFSILMPHPERVYRAAQLSWRPDGMTGAGPWLRMFRNARRTVG